MNEVQGIAEIVVTISFMVGLITGVLAILKHKGRKIKKLFKF